MTNLRNSSPGLRTNNRNNSLESVRLHRISTREGSIFFKLVSNAVIHALECLLTALLSPIMMWKWLLNHDHFMVVLKIIIQVILELMMLIVFAGVSILTAAALIFEDAYKERALQSTKTISKTHRVNQSEENYKKKVIN